MQHVSFSTAGGSPISYGWILVAGALLFLVAMVKRKLSGRFTVTD
jgi:hypothetical protein